jgi:parallel beta-helix repeat protein
VVFYSLTIVTTYVNTEDGLIAHEPIYIDGDENFIYEKGVTAGSGTFNDPYMIENWKINASEARHSGIFIMNTRAHFIVRNVLVYDGMKIGYKEGITLLNVSNGQIEHVQSISNNCGISLYTGSSNITISENRILDNYEGINLDFSFSNLITLNLVSSNKYGITLDSSHNNSIFRNNITANNGDGIYLDLSSSNIISRNNIANNFYGISLAHSSSHNRLSGNIASSNKVEGIGIYSSSNNNTLVGNTVSNNTWGINLDSSTSSNTLSDNIVSLNRQYGIWLYYSQNNTLVGNTVSLNNYGIWLGGSSNNKILHNNFINNTKQVYDYSWDQPWEPPSINVWDDGYPSGGNYWSDHEGDDFYRGANQDEHGRDGIGDTPYVIDENNQDNYPLMHPWGSLQATIWTRIRKILYS